MGYSYAVICKSPKLQKKMCDFLEKNFKMPDGFLEHEILYFETDLSYCHYKNQIGCDHGPISPECRYVMETMLRWIALKVGKRKSNFKELFHGKYGLLPYVNYDSQYNIPVVLNTYEFPEVVHANVYLCNELGINIKPRSRFTSLFEASAKVKKPTEELMIKLDNLWSYSKKVEYEKKD